MFSEVLASFRIWELGTELGPRKKANVGSGSAVQNLGVPRCALWGAESVTLGRGI